MLYRRRVCGMKAQSTRLSFLGQWQEVEEFADATRLNTVLMCVMVCTQRRATMKRKGRGLAQEKSTSSRRKDGMGRWVMVWQRKLDDGRVRSWSGCCYCGVET